MSRLSIKIPEHQHQQIKAMASLSGLSIKDYVPERALLPLPSASDGFEQQALAQLQSLLAPRLAAAKRGEFYDSTIEHIIAEAHTRHRDI